MVYLGGELLGDVIWCFLSVVGFVDGKGLWDVRLQWTDVDWVPR